ncbi:hypothetical protein ACHAXT_003707, partial [Thalassiosira profunda]
REARPPLANFDACVEACDALAARGAPLPQPKPREGDDGNGNDGGEAREAECASNNECGGGGSELSSDGDAIPDCSVLVSPDGALLFASGGRSAGALRLREVHNSNNNETGGGEGDHGEGNQNSINGTSRPPPTADSVLLGSEECDSAVVTGYDLSLHGDRSLNGFSARGWHADAATSALAASRDALHNLLGFVEDVAAITKEGGARLSEARERWGSARRGAEGPLGGDTTGVGRALAALGEFYGGEAGGTAGRWARACSEGQRRSGSGEPSEPQQRQSATVHNSAPIDGLLPALRTSAQHAARRTSARERALGQIRSNVAEAQATLHKQKRWAEKCHARVAEEEANVDRLFAVKKMEHHEAYEEWRHRQEGRALRTANANENATEGGAATEPEAALSDDIWEMVRDVGEMESFGHTGYSPTAAAKQPVEVGGVRVAAIPPPPSPPRGSSRPARSNSGGGMPAPHDHLQREQSPPPRLMSRADVERESDLADLRAVARAADESVEDAAGKLLNVLTSADTTQRSARLAAETCLLSECNAARRCLRSLVALERAALEDKKARLAVLEAAVDAIDVRADIDSYISADKARPGGRSRAGEEDDGGVAAALAVLNSHHSEGEGGAGAQRVRGRVERGDYFEGWGGDDGDDGGQAEDDDDGVGPELFTDVIRRLFDEGAADASATDSPDSDERLALATKALAEKTARGQSHRKSVLYELNQQRSQNTRVGGRAKFDALCRIFDAFLAGCGREPVDVSQCKMLMILSQTFYLVDDAGAETETDGGNDGNGDSKPPADEGNGGTHNDRHDRLYVKGRIAHHALWSDPSFWDQAVYQCVSESLAKSGVLLNYVGATEADGPGGAARDLRDVRWHDLPPAEYAGAAAQVHSVVFAQLGTLSHSMIELGCGIPMAVGFVRRLSIRYQLPLSLRITLIQHLTRKQGDGNAS